MSTHTSEKRCPTCGAELQRFTSRLHCPACNKDVTLTSNSLAECSLRDAAYNERWIERVKSKCVVNENGCWIWQRFCHPFRNMKPGQRGYPGGAYGSKSCRVHRKMLEVKLSKILPSEIHACHDCDTPPCCNPDHLYPGTNQQNHIDGGKRKRMQGQTNTHCLHGHEFTPENTRMKLQGPGLGYSRSCKTCERIRFKSPEYLAWARTYRKQRRAKLKAMRMGEQHGG